MLADAGGSAHPKPPVHAACPMGCIVEATFHARGPLLVREQRVWRDGALVAESHMAWAVAWPG